MIGIKEAKSIFAKAHPELTVIAIKSWDAEHYVLIALKDPNKQEMDPYYGIDKKTGVITDFSPAGQFKKFFSLFKINKPDGVEEDQKEVYEEMKHSAREWYMNSSTDELKHWGILGMKWGLRRFQNPDGSLTPEGRERYGVRGEKKKTAYQSSIESKKVHADSPGEVNRERYERNIERISNAWNHREVTGENSYRAKHYNDLGGEPIDLVEKGEDWKALAWRAEDINKNLAPYRNEYNELSDAFAKAINPKKRAELRQEYRALEERWRKAYAYEVDKYLDEAMRFIDQLPREDREGYEAYCYELLGYDW